MKSLLIALVVIFTSAAMSKAETRKVTELPQKAQPDPEAEKVEDESDLESIVGVEKNGGASMSDRNVIEILPGKDYLQLNEIDKLPKNLLRLDKNTGRELFISRKEAPFIYISGKIDSDTKLSINHSMVEIQKGKFKHKLSPPLESAALLFTLIDSSGESTEYRVLNHWKKIPTVVRFKVKEGDQIVEKALGFPTEFLRSAFAQLYSETMPVKRLDLDSVRHAKLTFRIHYSRDDAYDSWKLTIRDSGSNIVGEVKKLGVPPLYVEWRDLTQTVFNNDRYEYFVTLYKNEQAFEGPKNHFDAVEGLSLYPHPYLPDFQFEPRGDIGHLSFEDRGGTRFSSLYMSADLPFVLYNRLILRGSALTTLHSLDSNTSFTFTRLGAGLRVGTSGYWKWLGNPFMARLDILANYSGYTTYPLATIKRLTHLSLLIEPHLVLWTYHYFIPWFEYGFRFGGEQERFSYGVSYNFFVRPWSLRFGMGIAFDKLTRMSLNPDLTFGVFRVLTSATFFL